MATSVGFIGVGNMGNPMAGNVLSDTSVVMTIIERLAAVEVSRAT